MLKKIMTLALALAMVAGVMASTADQADARGRGGRVAAGVVAGIIGLGLLGAAANARGRTYYRSEPACYRGPRECTRGPDRCWYNRFGDYVCRRGVTQCYSRTYCD